MRNRRRGARAGRGAAQALGALRPFLCQSCTDCRVLSPARAAISSDVRSVSGAPVRVSAARRRLASSVSTGSGAAPSMVPADDRRSRGAPHHRIAPLSITPCTGGSLLLAASRRARVEIDLEAGVVRHHGSQPPANVPVARRLREPEPDIGRAGEPVAEQGEPVAELALQALLRLELRSRGPARELELLDRLPDRFLRPVPVTFGRFRYRSGLVARRAAEDLAPMRRLEALVREAALEPRR